MDDDNEPSNMAMTHFRLEMFWGTQCELPRDIENRHFT